VDEDLRGNKLGYIVFNAIMETVGRSASLAVLRAAPILSDTTPAEGTPAHADEVAALRRYWEGMGFYDIGGGYMAFGGVEGHDPGPGVRETAAAVRRHTHASAMHLVSLLDSRAASLGA
jgi:hypothetical protein